MRPTIDEWEMALVEMGLLTEKERQARAIHRILVRQLRRRKGYHP